MMMDFTVAIKGDKVEWHSRGCKAASRSALETTARTMGVDEFTGFRAEVEAEAKELGECGTKFHSCIKVAR